MLIPQMFPLNWIFLFFFFFLSYYTFLSLLYFFIPLKIINKYKKKNSKIVYSWKNCW